MIEAIGFGTLVGGATVLGMLAIDWWRRRG